MQFDFDDLVGNSITLSLIKRALKNDTFNQVSIFSGPRGTGKSTCAKIVAKSLVCAQPEDGRFCGKCPICHVNAEAEKNGTDSPWIKVVNLGMISRTDDVNALIEEVFKVQNSSQKQVYLFEELHALKGVKNGFTALLSEIDSISPNTYIVGTTTELRDVKEELQSRALKFEFKRLNVPESRVFIHKVLARKSLRVSKEIEDILIKQCKGIPREIEKLVDFVADNSVTLEEIKEYLQVVSDYVFAEMFFSMSAGSFARVLELLESAEETASIMQIIEYLKEFLVNVVFYRELGESDVFSEDEKAMVSRALLTDPSVLHKTIGIVEKLGRDSSRNDLVLALVKISAVMKGQKETVIVANRKTEAAKEKADVKPVEATEKPNRGLTPLSMKSLTEFGV